MARSMIVWVVYASKYGSTREVAEAVAEEIGHDHEISVRDAADVSGFDEAGAVVVGSAIYGGRWLEPARNLIGEHAPELARRPTWLFSVGPIGDPPKPEDTGPDGIADVVAATRAREHHVFAGKLDYSQLGRLERLMVKAFRAPEGDFRDWEAIRAWGRSIAASLQQGS
jgi:menaquinone-dependent protoporphyrinogen oxidase